ncbi:MAG TPA: cupin domain-containing protein [Terriglobales bacterium]|nr:cupin domain-containing protein [Terriglobales bacterium]
MKRKISICVKQILWYTRLAAKIALRAWGPELKIVLQRVSEIGNVPQRLKPPHMPPGKARLKPRSPKNLCVKYALLALLVRCSLFAQERQVDPTWLRRSTSAIDNTESKVASGACRYKPIFGDGDRDARSLRTVTRFGDLVVGARSHCQSVVYDRDEEIYFVLRGSAVLRFAGRTYPMRTNDFTYLPPGITHSLSNDSDAAARVLIMGFRIPQHISIGTVPQDLKIVNLDDVKEENVNGHPTSVLYKLLIGSRTATRDAIDQAYIMTSFFWMDFAPGGTNFPHHHEGAEEIYLVMDGAGEMIAGGGMDGVEGRHPATTGDAYYFRANCTVGFYNQNKPGAKAYILAVRARIPPPDEDD